MKEFDCVFCGTATYDLLALVQHIPLSDQRIKAITKLESGGGPAATAAVALQKLGMKSSLITGIGEDEIGERIVKELKSFGVDLAETKIIPGQESSFSIILVERDSGKRAITYYGGCLSHLDTSQINTQILKETNLLHLDGNHFSFAYNVARFVKTQTEAAISLDGGNIPGEQLFQLLPYVDIFITDEKSTNKIIANTNLQDSCRLFYDKGPHTVVITMGEKGVIAYNGDEFFQLPAYSVDVVDTTGAGDNFHGAFLYGHLSGWNLLDNLQFSSAFAALTCRGLGGRSAIPTLKETKKLIFSKF
jgi:sulfofructose kinase